MQNMQPEQKEVSASASDHLASQLKDTALPAWRSEVEQRRIDIVQLVSPAVVSVATEGGRSLKKNSVENLSEGEFGSGVIIDVKQGIVLTSAHLVAGADKIRLGSAGRMSDARVLHFDAELDVAILRAESLPADAVACVTCNAASPVTAQSVIAIGNPFGLEKTVSTGIVSAVRRTELADGRLIQMIQTDAAVNPGSSGGPLLDMDGRLIGIISKIYTQSGTSSGIAFAIPIQSINGLQKEALDKPQYDIQ